MMFTSAAELSDWERSAALNHVPKPRRAAVLAIWQLDETLGRIVASTTEPMIGQMRLTWWHDRLCGLDAGERAAEPLLSRLAADVLHHGITGTELAVLIEGWEALLEPMPLDDATLAIFAEKRGAQLFRLSGGAAAAAGQGWALVDFAVHCSDAATAQRAVTLARERLVKVGRIRPKALHILTRMARAKAFRTGKVIGEPLSRFDFLRAVLG